MKNDYIAVFNIFSDIKKSKFFDSIPVKIVAENDSAAIDIATTKCNELTQVSESYYECINIARLTALTTYNSTL